MNRRDAIRAALGGIAAACGLKAVKAERQIMDCEMTLTERGCVTVTELRWYDRDGNPITNSRGEPMCVEYETVTYRIPDGMI